MIEAYSKRILELTRVVTIIKLALAYHPEFDCSSLNYDEPNNILCTRPMAAAVIDKLKAIDGVKVIPDEDSDDE